MQQNPTGRVAMISGGLGGIGQAIAIELGRCGAAVAVGDLFAQKEAEPRLATMREASSRLRYDRVDVTDAGAVEQWVADVGRDLGTADLIIANAAIGEYGEVTEVTATRWRNEMQVNLDGAFHLAMSAGRKLIAKKRPGRIVFIGSWAAEVPHPAILPYCVSKAALRMLMKCLALEWAPFVILVNEIALGNVDAGLTARHFDANPGVREATRQVTPNRRLISADQVAVEVARLCAPENDQMAGTVLLVDGGLSLRSKRG